MQFFSTREIAFLIWGAISLFWVFINPKIRPSAINVIRSFFARPILLSFAVIISYVIIIIFILKNLGLFENSQLKDTFIWTISVAAASLVNINSISNDKNYFKDAIIKNLIALIGIEFILSYYTFNLIFELLIIPIAVLIGGMQAIAETDNKYSLIKTNFNRVVVVFGLVAFFHAIYKLITGFDEFISSGALKSIYYPVLLTFLYFPFIFFVSLYIEYQHSFRRIKFSLRNTSLLRYTKIKALLDFNFRKKQLKRWSNSLGHFTLETKEDVIASFQRIKNAIKSEKKANQITLISSDGWNPYIAKDFLKDNGLISGYYSPCSDDEWYSCTPYLKLGDEFNSNNLAYYTDGKRKTAKILKLVLNVNNPDEAEDDIELFLFTTENLYTKALKHDFPDQYKRAILTEHNLQESLEDNIVVSFIKNKWQSINGGYEYKFIIENTVT